MQPETRPVSFWPYQSKEYAAELEAAITAHQDKFGHVRRVWINPKTLDEWLASETEQLRYDKESGRYYLGEIPVYHKSGCRSVECMVFS